MKNGSLAALQSGMLVNEASADILSQLGITLTAYGTRSLLSGSNVAAKAEAGLARGIMAQASGASVEALFNYTQAINFDPAQIEALARLNVLSSSISGGSLSERIVNDLQARDRWLEAFMEASRFFNEHPPFEITFDPNLVQEGETDYEKRTATLGMRVALDPSEAGFAALNALLGGLEQTGRRETWGFRGWPLQDINPKTPGTVVFAGKQSLSFKLDVTLLNEKGKTIGKSNVTLTSGRLGFAAGDREVPAPNGAAGMMRFTNVKADDLTPTLTIVISAVNGIPSATLNANGYMRIDAGDLDKKNAAVFNNSALAFFNKGDWDRAIADYNRAIQLDPSNTAYKDNLQAAVNAVQKAAAEYNTSGLAYFNKKEYDRAIADYNQAIWLDPSNTAYRDNLAAAQKAQADQIAAAQKAEAASYNTSGLANYKKKEYDRAIADYDQAIWLDPSNTAYRDNLVAAQKARENQIAAARKAEALALANMVYINGGTFMMGSPASEAARGGNETQHQVTVSGFCMGKYEVTQREYEEVMGTNPSSFKGASLPMEAVRWFDAVEYCNKRSQREGLSPAYTISGSGDNRTVSWNRNASGYRLPTEAEWEYACRAGTTTPFSTGNNITTNQANYNGNYPYTNNAKGVYRGKTTTVGSFAPNRWGLYDMHGNVYEWCWDWYGDYDNRAQTDPIGAASGSFRVYRGGSWNFYAADMRSACRNYGAPEGQFNGLGFRVVRP